MSFTASNDTQVKVRDVRRVSDVKIIQTYLDFYFDKNSQYPSNVAELTKKLIVSMPENAQPEKGACPFDSSYDYKPTADFKSYTITYCLEKGAAGIKAGENIATPGKVTQNYDK